MPVSVSLAEIEIILRDAVRDTSLASVIELVSVRASPTDPGGWTLDLDADISEGDARSMRSIAEHLGRTYSLR